MAELTDPDGIDVLLSARRVAPTVTAHGLDMTAEMLALARANHARANSTARCCSRRATT